MGQRAIKIVASDHQDQGLTSAHSASLISSRVDLLLIGGGSLLLLALMSLMLKNESPDSSLGWFVFNLSFAVNFPHFLVSYQILYADFGSRIFKEARFFWAAVVVPMILLGVMAYGFLAHSPQTLGYMANAMFFFVGWHYVKQIFGGIAVTNALKKFYFDATERAALKWNLFSLWAISFLMPNIGLSVYAQDGITYSSLNLPVWTLTVAYASLALSAFVLMGLVLHKYVKEGRWPAPAAMVCFLTIYAWYLPMLKHPMFMHTIPFFHSLQYLLFVYAFRRNKVQAQVEHPETPEGRQQTLTGLYGYLLVSACMGAVFMYQLPRFIDGLELHNREMFGPTPAYFAFILFINVHHYFIDNVIWRGNNPEMKQYLFQSK